MEEIESSNQMPETISQISNNQTNQNKSHTINPNSFRTIPLINWFIWIWFNFHQKWIETKNKSGFLVEILQSFACWIVSSKMLAFHQIKQFLLLNLAILFNLFELSGCYRAIRCKHPSSKLEMEANWTVNFVTDDSMWRRVSKKNRPS